MSGRERLHRWGSGRPSTEDRGNGGHAIAAGGVSSLFLGPRSSVVLSAVLPLLLTGCPWFTTFTDQPRQEPWEQQWSDTVAWLGVPPESLASRGNPQFSVPIYGTTVAAFVVSTLPTPGALDSLALLPNPTAVSDSSIANGRRHFQIYCAVCHGAGGGGDGPVIAFGLPAPSLLTDITRNRTDGYLYGIIRNGRGLMPSYNRVEDMDRWDVVNYMRGLQGRLGAPVSTEPAGQPGENGPAVPTYSVTAPTRPVPYARPTAEAPNEPTAAASADTVAAAPAAGSRP